MSSSHGARARDEANFRDHIHAEWNVCAASHRPPGAPRRLARGRTHLLRCLRATGRRARLRTRLPHRRRRGRADPLDDRPSHSSTAPWPNSTARSSAALSSTNAARSWASARVSVDPAAQNHGVGRALMEAMFASAARAACARRAPAAARLPQPVAQPLRQARHGRARLVRRDVRPTRSRRPAGLRRSTRPTVGRGRLQRTVPARPRPHARRTRSPRRSRPVNLASSSDWAGSAATRPA